MRGRSPSALLALALLTLLLGACAKEKKAEKKPEAKKAAAQLDWQVRQVRLTEPCRTAELLRQQKAGATAAAAPLTPAAAPNPAPAAPPPATPPPAAGTPASAPAEDDAEPGTTPPGTETAAPSARGPSTADPGTANPSATDPAAAPAPAPAPPADDPAICVRFVATYPEFEKGMPRTLLQRLNDAVKELVNSPSFDERRAGSVDGTGRRLITAWKTRMQEKRVIDKSGILERWYDERRVDILYRDPTVISFRLTEKLYTGGAQELSTALYVSYSLDRIDRLSMADIFAEGSAKALNELGERKFRAARGIPPGRSLAEAGFDFPGGYFRLSANFAVTAEGLIFRYNPYDVAPKALGETEVALEIAELEKLIRPLGPLGNRADTPPVFPASSEPVTPAAAPALAEPAGAGEQSGGDEGGSDEAGSNEDIGGG